MKAAKRLHEENTDSLTSRTLNVLFRMCFVICVPTFMMEEANSNGLNIKWVRPEGTVKEKLWLAPVLRIQTDLDRIRIRPLRTDRIQIHLSTMYLVVPKV
jgi:hypothetical protein